MAVWLIKCLSAERRYFVSVAQTVEMVPMRAQIAIKAERRARSLIKTVFTFKEVCEK